MIPVARLTLAAAAVTAGIGFAPAADAAWWNPFRRDPPQAQSLPPPPQPPSEVPGAPSNDLVVAQDSGGAALRLERMEAQMRTLTGQVEELTHQVRQLQEQLQRMQEDTDYRIRELQGGSAPAAATPDGRSGALATPAPDNRQVAAIPNGEAPMDEVPMDAVDPRDLPAPADARPALADARPAPGGPAGGPQLGAPPRSLGEVPAVPGGPGGAPLDLSAVIRNNGQVNIDPNVPPADPELTAALTGDARTDYDNAYQHLLAGDYAGAEVSFRTFLSSYPDDRLAADAQFWIGESLYSRGEFREAADEFLTAYRAYPGSAKAPDTLLKLGMSLAGLGQRDAACASYAQVLRQFPDASTAVRERVKAEQGNASC